MKKIFKKTLLVIALVVLITSCTNTDDFTDDSTLIPSNPALIVALDFNNEETLIENGQIYNFTVSISEPQVVDVSVKLSQTGGTATDGDDFSMPHDVVIPKGTTTASGSITILNDDLVEETEDAIILIATGFESNVGSTTSQTVKFNIENYTEGDLVVHMDWTTPKQLTDNFGNKIDPDDFADMRLLLTDIPYTKIIKEADGGSYETMVINSSVPDGEYYIVADFYDALDIPSSLNINTEFDQSGVINGAAYSFPSIISNESICPANYAILNKVIKSGDSYEIVSVGQNNFAANSITWFTGYDVKDKDGEYASHIESKVDCDGNYFLGINKEWMEGFWGETITKKANVYYTIDAAGKITIPSQYIFTTLFSGVNYDYTISGTGKLDKTTNTVTLNYVLDQDGFSPSGWAFDNGYITQSYFIAVVKP